MTNKFKSILGSFVESRGLSDSDLSALLGVPVFTLKKWQAGQREPSAATIRLFELVAALDVLAPAILENFIPEKRHVEKSTSTDSTDSNE